MDLLWIQTFVASPLIQLLEHANTLLHGLFRTSHLKVIAAITDMHTKSLFNLAQVLIELPTQIRQHLIVQRFEHNLATCVCICPAQVA
jgi:hypothetical protein